MNHYLENFSFFIIHQCLNAVYTDARAEYHHRVHNGSYIARKTNS